MIDPINYIKQQLVHRKREVTYQNFLFIPFSDAVLRYEVNGYNQHLFVEISKLPEGTTIIADNNAVHITEKHKDTQAWEEFTGQIIITLKQAQEGGIEFIQIISKEA